MFEKSHFESLEKKRADNVTLNTSLTDILSYVITNYQTTLDDLKNKGKLTNSPSDTNFNALWRKLDVNPLRLFLPNFLIVRVFEIRKLLELGEELDFDYIEERLNISSEPLNQKYNIVGVICQKKGQEKFYPAIKEKENIFDLKFKGFVDGQERVASINAFNREFVHFIVFERRDIQF